MYDIYGVKCRDWAEYSSEEYQHLVSDSTPYSKMRLDYS